MRARLLTVLAVLLLVLPGCAKPAPPAPSQPAEVTIRIRLTKGGVSPNGERRDIALGTKVTFVIESDHADTVHVHGYDTEIPVKQDTPARHTLTADRPGRYEVESHDPAMTILFLNVR